MRKVLFVAVLLCYTSLAFGVEGMWIPTLLKKYNIEEMQKMGFKLTADDIYSINQSSLKDAVVIFGGGCTGEMISADGLLITNHHCGYAAIQSHSSIEHDYLTDGFWAKSKAKELPNKGLTVKFLEKMEDVTDQVFRKTEGLSPEKAEEVMDKNIAKIIKSYKADQFHTVLVKPIFAGNQYFLHIYKVFKDVRLVGAPPSSIGKFGGDTDNWMWPRHTGDFSLFRVYADKDGNPAEYSESNVPYTPKRHLKIDTNGIKEGEFTMVFGFPGSTNEYLPSYAIDQIINQSNPDKIDIRTKKLDIMTAEMAKDRGVRIKYARKAASTSNSWKRWIGEVKGLNRLDAINVKIEGEKLFQQWANETPEKSEKYGALLGQFKEEYADLANWRHLYDTYTESIYRGSDVMGLTRTLDGFVKSATDGDKVDFTTLESKLNSYFKDYDKVTDLKLLRGMLEIYVKEMDSKYVPSYLSDLDNVIEDYNSSILSNKEQMLAIATDQDLDNLKKLANDPTIKLYRELSSIYKPISKEYHKISNKIAAIQKVYMQGIANMNKGKRLMADANSTLRVSYGKVEGYWARDAVYYTYQTTLDGIMEKDNPEIYDYDIPQKLRDLYKNKQFGSYLTPDGQVPVAFCASNHTTGGNSGSPVLDSNGALIGVNFDRCWEGTMSDLMFDPERCRNITLDIRYVLFIIEQLSDAPYLMDELDLIESN